MGYISLPDDAEAVFRLTITPSFDPVLEVKLWGVGKQGWVNAHRREKYASTDLVVVGQRLLPGQWRSLINHVHRSNFWGLAEHLPESEWMVCDGTTTALEVRQGEREHRVSRHENLEPGLARTVNFMLRASTLMEQMPDGLAACYLQTVKP